jgi:hypothetical protein
MALGREMHHGARLVALKQFTHQGRVSDIPSDEDVSLIFSKRSQSFHVPGITEYVEIDHTFLALCQPV